MVTRLYSYVRCEKCGKPYSADLGVYFGKKLWDEDVYHGLCFMCEMDMRLEKKKREQQKREGESLNE